MRQQGFADYDRSLRGRHRKRSARLAGWLRDEGDDPPPRLLVRVAMMTADVVNPLPCMLDHREFKRMSVELVRCDPWGEEGAYR